jgi:2-oxoglutarate dehydrogenase complex dehydrogenase (E1) component-like enzyme
VKRVVFCTGKVGHELLDRRDQLGAPAAVVRLEQLYPFREDLIGQTLDRYPAATEVLWVQEEPENMGAWSWIDWRLHRIVAPRRTLDYVARAESAAPAGGSATIHEAEQEELLSSTFSGL